MTGWTLDRLDAIPADTLIRMDRTRMIALGEGWFVDRFNERWSSPELLDDGSGRAPEVEILAVNVASLLADDAVEAAEDGAWLSDAEGWSAGAAIRAAIAHVTGYRA